MGCNLKMLAMFGVIERFPWFPWDLWGEMFSGVRTPSIWAWVSLWWTNITMEHHNFNGKISYKWLFSIAMSVITRGLIRVFMSSLWGFLPVSYWTWHQNSSLIYVDLAKAGDFPVRWGVWRSSFRSYDLSGIRCCFDCHMYICDYLFIRMEEVRI